jgi:integrase
MITKNKNGEWIIDFTCKGHRITRIFGKAKAAAEAEEDRIKTEIRAGRFIPLKQKGAKQNDGSFKAQADEFLELYSKQHKRSWARDEISLKHLSDFFEGASLAEIDGLKIEKYILHRTAAGSSKSTINRELACLKTMFGKAVEWGKVEKSPAAKVKKFREPNARERILSPEEARRLIESADPGIRPVLIIALNTGMRRGEILSLKWADLDFTKSFILISDSKSGRSRKIFMNALLYDTLKALPKGSSEYVFFNAETEAHVKDVKTAFKTACRRAKKDPNDEKDPGIVGLRFHDLRHTAATRMIEAGVDLVTVSKILGHASIQMTMRYAHPTPETMRRAVEKLGDFLKRGRDKVETVILKPLAIPLKTYN